MVLSGCGAGKRRQEEATQTKGASKPAQGATEALQALQPLARSRSRFTRVIPPRKDPPMSSTLLRVFEMLLKEDFEQVL